MPVPRASDFSREMPPDPVDVSFKGMTLTVDKNKVTRRWAEQADRDFYGTLSQVMLSWDLVNDDDTIYEISTENWLALNLTLAQELEMVEAIVQACIPSRAEGNESSPSVSDTPTAEAPGTNGTSSPLGSEILASPPASASAPST